LKCGRRIIVFLVDPSDKHTTQSTHSSLKAGTTVHIFALLAKGDFCFLVSVSFVLTNKVVMEIEYQFRNKETKFSEATLESLKENLC
jgi:hypothetical protein